MITGSNGFVGSKLMYVLSGMGHQVIGIDISEECPIEKHPDSLSGDIRKTEHLSAVTQKFRARCGADIDVIIHCAAAKHDFGITRGEYFSHNKYGTKSVMDFATANKIHKVMYISTVSVFGHPNGEADESAPYAADHPYGESKLAGELISIDWQKEEPSRELLILRPTVIYGPHSRTNVYNLIDMLHRRPWVTIGRGDHIKSIVSLDSVISMICYTLDLFQPGIQDFNCVDEPYITLHELMSMIAAIPGFSMPKVVIPKGIAIGIGRVFDIPGKLLGIDLPVNSDRMRKLSTPTYFRADKIRKAGYLQARTTQECVAEMCEWYLKVNR